MADEKDDRDPEDSAFSDCMSHTGDASSETAAGGMEGKNAGGSFLRWL